MVTGHRSRQTKQVADNRRRGLPAGRRHYKKEAAALAGLRRWTVWTEADHTDPDRPIPFRFFLYRLEAFFRSLDLETRRMARQGSPRLTMPGVKTRDTHGLTTSRRKQGRRQCMPSNVARRGA